MTPSEPVELAERFRGLAVAARGDADALTRQLHEQLRPEDVTAALTALARVYAVMRQEGEHFLPVDRSLTATDAVILCQGVLQAADLQVFELGLWQSWGRVG